LAEAAEAASAEAVSEAAEAAVGESTHFNFITSTDPYLITDKGFLMGIQRFN